MKAWVSGATPKAPGTKPEKDVQVTTATQSQSVREDMQKKLAAILEARSRQKMQEDAKKHAQQPVAAPLQDRNVPAVVILTPAALTTAAAINSNPTVVREFARGSQAGPRTENFIERGESLCNAARELLRDANISKHLKDRILLDIENAFESFNRNIKYDCDINPPVKPPFKSMEEQFNDRYPKALELLQELSASLVVSIYKAEYEQDLIKKIMVTSAPAAKADFEMAIPQELEKARERLVNKEIQMISARPRNNLVNLVPIDDSFGNSSNNYLVSSQFAATAQTTPSIVTNAGNRNFVISTVSVRHDAAVNVVDKDFRLGAICSYGLTDKETGAVFRHCQNAKNARELLEVVAAQQYVAKGSTGGMGTEKDPIELDLFSLTLVTPLNSKADSAAKKAGIPSELDMISEHHQALMLYHNRPIPVKIGNDVIYFKPKISHANIPTNLNQYEIGGKKFSLHDLLVNDLQDKINAQGFYDYFRYIENYLANSQLLHFSPTSSDAQAAFSSKQQSDLKRIATELESYLEFFKHDPKLKAVQEELKQLILNNEKDLIEENIKLEKLLKMIEDLSDRDTEYAKSIIGEYEAVLKKINDINDKVYKKYLAVEVVKSALLQSREAIQRNNELSELTREFLKSNQAVLSTPDGEKLRQDLLVAQTYLTNQRLYFNSDGKGNYKRKEYAFTMLAGMHLSLFAADINHTSGCKSAKDRTGLLNIYKEAMTIYFEKHGCYPDPRSESEFAELQQIIQEILYKTASVYNSEENCPGVLGLQVKLPTYSPAKQMGLLAKDAVNKSAVKLIEVGPLVTAAITEQHLVLFDDVRNLMVECNKYFIAIADPYPRGSEKGRETIPTNSELEHRMRMLMLKYKRESAETQNELLRLKGISLKKIDKQAAEDTLMKIASAEKRVKAIEYNIVALDHMLKNEATLQNTLSSQATAAISRKQVQQNNNPRILRIFSSSSDSAPSVSTEEDRNFVYLRNFIHERTASSRSLMRDQQNRAERARYVNLLQNDAMRAKYITDIAKMDVKQLITEKNKLSALYVEIVMGNDKDKTLDNIQACIVECLKQIAKLPDGLTVLNAQLKSTIQATDKIALIREIEFVKRACYEVTNGVEFKKSGPRGESQNLNSYLDYIKQYGNINPQVVSGRSKDRRALRQLSDRSTASTPTTVGGDPKSNTIQ